MEKYWHRGIYVEEDEIRCRCNNKNCNKWDTYQYDRHFGFKVHKRYEEEEADETFHRSTMVAFVQSEAEKEAHRISLPGAAPALPSIPAFSTVHVGKSRTGEDARMQEDHWMKMWSAAKDELKKLRQDLKDEEDEEVIGEIEADIKGLRKRKADFAKLLGFAPEL